MEAKNLDDRQLDAILERLDRLCDEVHAISRRLDQGEGLLRVAHELVLDEDLAEPAAARTGRGQRRVELHGREQAGADDHLAERKVSFLVVGRKCH